MGTEPPGKSCLGRVTSASLSLGLLGVRGNCRPPWIPVLSVVLWAASVYLLGLGVKFKVDITPFSQKLAPDGHLFETESPNPTFSLQA